MTYLKFLNLLLSFGPKIPAAIALIQEIIAKLQALADLFKPVVAMRTAKPKAVKVSAVTAAAEAKVLAALKGKGNRMRALGVSSFSAGWLREIWAFILAHPEIWALILSLLGKK